MHKIIKKHPVIAILRNTPPEDLGNYVQALYDGGFRAFEVSFSAEGAAGQLAWIKEHLPEDACVGAGTILTEDDARRAVQAGADFMLSPSSDPPVMEYCRSRQIPLLPGVFSPTDVSRCLSYGYRTLKLFPASDLPLHYIKSPGKHRGISERRLCGGGNRELADRQNAVCPEGLGADHRGYPPVSGRKNLLNPLGHSAWNNERRNL